MEAIKKARKRPLRRHRKKKVNTEGNGGVPPNDDNNCILAEEKGFAADIVKFNGLVPENLSTSGCMVLKLDEPVQVKDMETSGVALTLPYEEEKTTIVAVEDVRDVKAIDRVLTKCDIVKIGEIDIVLDKLDNVKIGERKDIGSTSTAADGDLHLELVDAEDVHTINITNVLVHEPVEIEEKTSGPDVAKDIKASSGLLQNLSEPAEVEDTEANHPKLIETEQIRASKTSEDFFPLQSVVVLEVEVGDALHTDQLIEDDAIRTTSITDVLVLEATQVQDETICDVDEGVTNSDCLLLAAMAEIEETIHHMAVKDASLLLLQSSGESSDEETFYSEDEDNVVQEVRASNGLLLSEVVESEEIFDHMEVTDACGSLLLRQVPEGEGTLDSIDGETGFLAVAMDVIEITPLFEESGIDNATATELSLDGVREVRSLNQSAKDRRKRAKQRKKNKNMKVDTRISARRIIIASSCCLSSCCLAAAAYFMFIL